VPRAVAPPLVESLVRAALCAVIGSFRPIAPKTPGRRRGSRTPGIAPNSCGNEELLLGHQPVQSQQRVVKFGAEAAVERYV
jgi:hypothetical protein